QEELSAEARLGLFGEPKELSVSQLTSLVPPMLSPFPPMLSPGHPTPFFVEGVVVQQFNLVFGRSKPAQKESAKTGRKFLSYHRWIRSCLVVDEQIGEGFEVKRKSMLLRCRRGLR